MKPFAVIVARRCHSLFRRPLATPTPPPRFRACGAPCAVTVPLGFNENARDANEGRLPTNERTPTPQFQCVAVRVITAAIIPRTEEAQCESEDAKGVVLW